MIFKCITLTNSSLSIQPKCPLPASDRLKSAPVGCYKLHRHTQIGHFLQQVPLQASERASGERGHNAAAYIAWQMHLLPNSTAASNAAIKRTPIALSRQDKQGEPTQVQ